MLELMPARALAPWPLMAGWLGVGSAAQTEPPPGPLHLHCDEGDRRFGRLAKNTLDSLRPYDWIEELWITGKA